MLNLIFFSLFVQLAVGTLLPLFFMSLEEIGVTFFRFMSGVAALLLAIAWWAHPFAHPIFNLSPLAFSGFPHPVMGLMAATIVILLAGSIWIKRGKKIYLFPAFALGLAVVVCTALFSPASLELPVQYSGLRAASFLASALLLGTVMSAMITGHWYLVNRRLTIQPLRIATVLFLGATVLRLVLVIAVVSVLALSRETLVSQAAQALLQFSGQGWLFWLRFAIGLIGPLVFGGMIYATVKIRSTQSATGMLYATVVFVFLGEAFAKFIWLFTGIPV
ncbi:MAG: hypothetical protein ACREOO_20730 [bacterium]